MNDALTKQQIDDWGTYFRERPFGHWVDTGMVNAIVGALTGGQDAMPKVEIINLDQDEEEISVKLPNFGAAEQFLMELQRNGSAQSS